MSSVIGGAMRGVELLAIQPTELAFPFELKKQVSCSLRLVNLTSDYVAFKVKTTSPKKYCVRPNTGVIPPQSSAEVTVMMQAQKEAPLDMVCRDKFLVQSTVLPQGSSTKDVAQDLFSKEGGREVYEAKLKVIYVSPPQPPSPVAESPDEGIVSPSQSDRALNTQSEESAPAYTSKFAEQPATRGMESSGAFLKQGREDAQGQAVLKASRQRGWSVIHLIIVAILAFLLGRLLGQAPIPLAS